MQLVHMDVDRYGTQDRCQLGPLSPGLNAICGARGSGKTTLLSWLRSIAEEDFGSTYSDPAWHYTKSPVSGTVEIQNSGVRYSVSSDRNGRVQLNIHASGNGRPQPYINATNLSKVQREAFAGLAAAQGASDTERALADLASRLGLQQHTDVGDRQRLMDRQADLEQRLQRLGEQSQDRERLLTRKVELETELANAHRAPRPGQADAYPVENLRLDQRCRTIEADLRATQQEIEQLDRAISDKQAQLKVLETSVPDVSIGESYRVQLQKIDDRLNRWRQTLKDLKAHRETLESNATDVRLDKQIGDQLSPTKDADPRAAMRALEAQILDTRQQLDVLVERYTTIPGYDHRSASAAVTGTSYRTADVPNNHGVYRDETGRTYVGYSQHLPESTLLPETLRSMQKDLHEVCQQLARHEAHTASESLKQQSEQLQRCEHELLCSVEKLIDERASLLRRISNEHHLTIDQLTLAFGNWCQCHDHPHLHEWLLREDADVPRTKQTDPVQRQQVIEELEQLQRQRKQAVLRSEDCRRQLNDVGQHRQAIVSRIPGPMVRNEVEIIRDLDILHSQLGGDAERDRLQSELADTRRQIASLQTAPARSPFQESTDEHIRRLMGVGRHYDNRQLNGTSYSTQREVPAAIVRIAMRLAIADRLQAQGEPVCVLLDCNLDDLPVEVQQAAVAHLNEVSKRGQQTVVLTSDQRVADSVQACGGWVGYMHARREGVDVNRHLAAVANDHELDKWYQPDGASHAEATGYYLSERSLVEDLPAIDPNAAARCRSLGVDRIGDLLAVDPQWLADEIGLSSVSYAEVVAWQARADLLCNVRNLRPFDARVIVGAGVRTPVQLSEMHPSQLLDRVERFLATDDGRRILRSGSSYELSRITSWIAAAKNGRAGGIRGYSKGPDYNNGYDRDNDSNGRRGDRYARGESSYRSARGDSVDRDSGSRSSSRSTRTRSSRSRSYSDAGRSRSTRRTSQRSARSYPVVSRSGRGRSSWEGESQNGNGQSDRNRERETRESVRITSTAKTEQSETRLKFYLELSSPVVDAPSIGPRMAARLEKHGIYTVDQLLAADPAVLAEQLDHRRVDEEVVQAWQEQARLVCRIPNLRGHDAQLLVSCELTSPEDLSTMEPAEVLSQVSVVAQSSEGQRILRGGKEPDLEEVQDWIEWATHCRHLNAA